MNKFINWIIAIVALAAFLGMVIFASQNAKPDPFFKKTPATEESSTYQPQFRFGLGSDGATPFF